MTCTAGKYEHPIRVVIMPDGGPTGFASWYLPLEPRGPVQ
jgi:hypothetical protein